MVSDFSEVNRIGEIFHANKGEFRPNSGFYWSCHTYNFKGNWLAQG